MKLPINYCYHCHTKRCGHAVGEDEEYILTAIEMGIKNLGISDHMPIPNFHQDGIRMDYSQIDEYIDSLTKLKCKYKNQINIYIGFECEYMKELKDYYKHLLYEKGVDYLIIGQHGILVDNAWVWYSSKHFDKAAITHYKDSVIEAMESGLFTYIAHPDSFMNGYQMIDDYSVKMFNEIVEASIRTNTPLEINAQGLTFKNRTDNSYPCSKLWDSIKEEYKKDLQVVIGIDAHDPLSIKAVERVDKCIDIARHAGVHLINNIKLKK